MSGDAIAFYSEGLLSKWGFGDGDMLDDLLYAYDFDFNQVTHFRPRGDIGLTYGTSHEILITVVCAFVIPKLDQRVEPYAISTIHNPIRAHRINGKLVPGAVIIGDVKHDFVLTPTIVEVDAVTILKVAHALIAPNLEES